MRRRAGKSAEASEPVSTPSQESYSRLEKNAKGRSLNSALGVFLLLIGSYVLSFLASSWWIYSTAIPLGQNAPKGVFSEARALQHVDILSNQIGHRQVSTPGLALGVTYVVEECERIASIANESGSLVAQVDQEDASGEYCEDFFRTNMTSAFRNMTNVIVYISPKGKENKKALLVNAHIDSAAGSTGASDCAVCVAIALEIARMIVERNEPLLTPIMFLFNGAEETFLQGASAFMRSSKWVDKVGAFINLESTGAGGMPMLFQYSGAWALNAFVKGSKYPRGTVFAQDVFKSRLIPADTDFRMFSQDHQGRFPGLDIATVLDAGAYHTSRDSFDRIVPGTTQEYGDSVAGAVDEFLKVMADGLPIDSIKEEFVYFDFFHSIMVLYDMRMGKWLHMLPFLVIGVGFFVQANKYSGIIGIGKMQLRWGVSGMVKTILSLTLALVLSMSLGFLWVFVTGKPMFWFSNHLAAACVYAPMALIGTIVLWKPDASALCCSSSLLGICTLLGAIGGQITSSGVSSGYHLCWKALFGGLMGMFIPEKLTSVWGAFPVLLFAILPLASGFTVLRVLCMHFMEKMSLVLASGHPTWGIYIPELVVSGLIGFAAWITAILLAPYIVGIQTRFYKWSSIAVLFMCSLGALALFGGNQPFSLYQPRMVHVDHVHSTAGGVNESYWLMSAWDSLPQEDILPPIFDRSKLQKTNPHDWLSCFPFQSRIRGYRVPASPTKTPPWGLTPPRIVRTDSRDSDEHLAHRISLELHWEKPGWGLMNMTGPILGWSFGNKVPKFIAKDGSTSYILRIFQDADDPSWPFWVEIEMDGALTIELVSTYLVETEELAEFTAQIPEYAAVIARTSSVSKWTFSTH